MVPENHHWRHKCWSLACILYAFGQCKPGDISPKSTSDPAKGKGGRETFPSIDKASDSSVGQQAGALISTLCKRLWPNLLLLSTVCRQLLLLAQPQHTQQGQHICHLPRISEGRASHQQACRKIIGEMTNLLWDVYQGKL